MAEPVIFREEVVRLLLTVYDMAETLEEIRDVVVEEDDDGAEEDEG